MTTIMLIFIILFVVQHIEHLHRGNKRLPEEDMAIEL